jgi:hypothetical protein
MIIEEERNAAIIEDFKAGMRYTDIGRAYDISDQRVRRIVQNEVRKRQLARYHFHYEPHHIRYLLINGPYPPWPNPPYVKYPSVTHHGPGKEADERRAGLLAAAKNKVRLLFDKQPTDEEWNNELL